ncbi:hypothetical protein [Xanthomonas arboricola]|uniref:hypothetical protein n=1 Tax=Xanthomonas arboricola TaxID=56448 RepID=UPI0011AECB5D|nr:hypothetical protein [Xanthomonas arboricola]
MKPNNSFKPTPLRGPVNSGVRPHTFYREYGQRLMESKASLTTLFILALFSGHAQSKNTSQAEFLVVQQCSEAARLVSRAAENFPLSKSLRSNPIFTTHQEISSKGLPDHLRNL